MPVEIFDKIAKNVDLKSRFALGHVCRNFKRIADNWDLKLTEVSIDSDKRCQISYGGSEKEPLGIEEIEVLEVVKTENISIGAVVHFLKNPRLEVKILKLRHNGAHYRHKDNVHLWLMRRLSSLRQKPAIHVKELRLEGCCSGECFYILPYLKPGVLKELKVYSPWKDVEFGLSQVSNTEQYKQLDTISIHMPQDFLASPTFVKAREAKWFQNCPNLRFRVTHVSDIALSWLVFDLLDSTKLRNFELKTRNVLDGFVKEVLKVRKNVITIDEQTFHSPIADTNDFFEVKFTEKSVCIERKTY